MFLCAQSANKVSDCPSQVELLALNHHVEWATLGFIRAIATSTAMCRALSTPAWVHLLLSMVGGQDNSIVITLPKQVCFLHNPLKPKISSKYLKNKLLVYRTLCIFTAVVK
jgi:aconitase B